MKHVSNIRNNQRYLTRRVFRCKCGTETTKSISDLSDITCPYCKKSVKQEETKLLAFGDQYE